MVCVAWLVSAPTLMVTGVSGDALARFSVTPGKAGRYGIGGAVDGYSVHIELRIHPGRSLGEVQRRAGDRQVAGGSGSLADQHQPRTLRIGDDVGRDSVVGRVNVAGGLLQGVVIGRNEILSVLVGLFGSP